MAVVVDPADNHFRITGFLSEGHRVFTHNTLFLISLAPGCQKIW